MKLIAFDTSTSTASVAVLDDGRCLAELSDDTGDHSDRLIGLVDECLQRSGIALAEVEAIAVGAGPGSFTGLRIGLATAKGLALALEIPLLAVSSLAALAARATPSEHIERIAAVVNAHRKEVFVGLFDATSRAPIGEERVLAPAMLSSYFAERGVEPQTTLVVGEGISLYPELVGNVAVTLADQPHTPSGRGVARVAMLQSSRDQLVHSTPSYLRPSEAEVRFPGGNPGGTFAPIGPTPDRSTKKK